MAWTKSPQQLAELFDATLPDGPDVVKKKVFGYPAGVVNGNMFAGLYRDTMILRLPDELMRDFTLAGGAPFEPMPGRPMKGFASAPAALLDDPPRLKEWLEKALESARAMKAKVPKARTAKTARPGRPAKAG